MVVIDTELTVSLAATLRTPPFMDFFYFPSNPFVVEVQRAL
jgi:hypothetical protein